VNISPKILVGLLIGILASTIWGGHAAVARLALTGQGLEVLDLLFCRYVPASLLLLPLIWRERAAMRALGWRRILVLFLFAGAGNLILFASALKYAPATHGSTIAPMVMPVAGALIAWWLLKERPTPGRAAALAAMLTGVLIIGWDGLGMHPGAWRGDLLLVGAGSTWAVFTILLRLWQVPAIPATAAVTLVSVPFVLPPFLYFRAEAFFALPTSLVIWMMVAQGVLLGVVSMLLFARSVEMLGATRASTLSVVVPVMGLITSALLLGETIGPVKALGATLSVSAMLVAVLFTGRRVG
jgi:drug/metabolite transporter (DMT)-like permease